MKNVQEIFCGGNRTARNTKSMTIFSLLIFFLTTGLNVCYISPHIEMDGKICRKSWIS